MGHVRTILPVTFFSGMYVVKNTRVYAKLRKIGGNYGDDYLRGVLRDMDKSRELLAVKMHA